MTLKRLLLLASVLLCVSYPLARSQPTDPAILTIEELYQNLPSLIGQQVKVMGFYTIPNDSKLISSYLDYLNRRKIPLGTLVFINGLVPDSLYWRGGFIGVTGVVSVAPNPHPNSLADSIEVTITASSYEYYLPGRFEPASPGIKVWDTGGLLEDREAMAGCDSCKFAILMSGGISDADNNPGFWEDIEALYKYKTDPAGGNYCPENVMVLYFEGNSGDPAAIPDAAVDSCTKSRIEAAHKEISRRIADCQRAGKDATVQKMVSNHGADDDGMCTLGNETLSPAELRALQQPLIDSCCDFMFDEFTQCYGGDFVDSLKGLDAKSKTEIHINSAAGNGSCAWGDDSGSPYLMEKIRQLRDSASYEDAVKAAKDKYKEYLDAARAETDSLIHELDSLIALLPPGDTLRVRLDSIRQGLVNDRNDLDDSINDGSPSWVRYIFKQYCEWKKIVVPPGGQFKLKFKGSGGCGNVSVYKENADGSKTRVKVWNWNLPGSAGYSPGNDTRVINADLTGTGIYWIHNDNGAFEVTVDALKDQTLPESASNIPSFAGFSLGGTDNSPLEFGNIVSPGMSIPNIELVPLNLQSVPRMIGPCGGVNGLVVTFNSQPNPWWGDMELTFVPYQVIQPGALLIQCPSAQFPSHNIPISPGMAPFTVHLGAIPTGMQQLQLVSQGGMCMMLDSWGMRSLLPTFPEYLCGDADGNNLITISDVVYLINYIFAGGPAPNPVQSGDADCNGIVTISDAVYLINFVFAGGPAPCSACK